MFARELLAALLVAAVTLSACAGASPDDTDSGVDDTEAAGSDSSPDADDVQDPDPGSTRSPFPVTIGHRHGETTIEQRPERVVTVGLTDHDAVLALGVVPVGTNDWYGSHPGGVWPWAQESANDPLTTITNRSDHAAALRPQDRSSECASHGPSQRCSRRRSP